MTFTALRSQRQLLLDDRVSVHAIPVGRAVLGEFGRSLESEGLRATELDGRPHLLDASSKAT